MNKILPQTKTKSCNLVPDYRRFFLWLLLNHTGPRQAPDKGRSQIMEFWIRRCDLYYATSCYLYLYVSWTPEGYTAFSILTYSSTRCRLIRIIITVSCTITMPWSGDTNSRRMTLELLLCITLIRCQRCWNKHSHINQWWLVPLSSFILKQCHVTRLLVILCKKIQTFIFMEKLFKNIHIRVT
jgi:hypothetical protein